jgi:hypothetical protein
MREVLRKFAIQIGIDDFLRDADVGDIPMGRIRDPSRMARTQTPHEASLERLGSWRNRLSPAEQRRVLDWAHRVGLTWYGDGPLPATISPTSVAEADGNSEPGR